MRSPVIAFSIFAAAAVSPTLVSGAPTSPNPAKDLEKAMQLSTRQLPNAPAPASTATGILGGILPLGNSNTQPSKKVMTPEAHRAAELALHNPNQNSIDSPSTDIPSTRRKRAMDMYTAGGNAYSGAAADTSGGNVVAVSHNGVNANGDGVTNDGGNTGGAGDEGFSGFSYGGDGDGKGAGGNAYTGSVGNSYGGDVVTAANGGGIDDGGDGTTDGGIDNEEANIGGAGGFDQSGDATGGDANGNLIDGVDGDNVNVRQKRAEDNGTAGGSAYTGASANVDGGDVYNLSDSDGEVINGAAQTGGAAGSTFSGQAEGGEGDGYGPGGNAYSGSTGSAIGGNVISSGGTVDNEAAITGGAGGESESGDAIGGDA